jgi:CMP-N,N'-diacetyllegionaminic acid synthase
MIAGKRVLAIIPARGGSKGVPRKNVRLLADKPLIAWSIACAEQSIYIDRCIISTDDEEIADVSRAWGGEVPFLRPPELAQDDTPGIAPVLHAIAEVTGYDYIVLLQPTSPLRSSADIDGCIEALLEKGAPSCVSVSLTDKSPLWMYTLDRAGEMIPIMEVEDRAKPRQQLPPIYVLNGAVYVAERQWLEDRNGFLGNETVAYVMPQERSLDIDTIEDFMRAEYRIQSC